MNGELPDVQAGFIKSKGTKDQISNIHSIIDAEGNGNPLRYSCLENPTDREAWWAAVHGVAKSRTRLRDFTFTFHFHALEKEMATHSSVLAWRIPGTEEPHGLLSMGSHRVGHDWSDLAAAVAAATSQNVGIREKKLLQIRSCTWVIYIFSLSQQTFYCYP